MKYLFSFLFFIVLTSCAKDEDQGCTGCLGSFQCKIDGKMWKPNCDSGTILWGCSAIDCLYYKDSGALELHVKNEDGNDRLSFGCRNLNLGRNPLFLYGREYLDWKKDGNCARYNLIETLPNSITLLKLDTINQIVQGRFEFSVLGTCEQDTLHITDGIFHLGYRF